MNAGLNWEGLDREEYSSLTRFFDQATHPDPDQRFNTVSDALAAITAERDSVTEVGTDDAKPMGRHGVQPSNTLRPTAGTLERQANEVSWLLSLLQSYPGSRWGNRETRDSTLISPRKPTSKQSSKRRYSETFLPGAYAS